MGRYKTRSYRPRDIENDNPAYKTIHKTQKLFPHKSNPIPLSHQFNMSVHEGAHDLGDGVHSLVEGAYDMVHGALEDVGHLGHDIKEYVEGDADEGEDGEEGDYDEDDGSGGHHHGGKEEGEDDGSGHSHGGHGGHDESGHGGGECS